MKNSADILGNGASTDDRFAGQLSYRGRSGQRRDGLTLPEQNSSDALAPGILAPRGGSAPPLDDIATMPTMLEPPPISSSMSSGDADSSAEPVFPPPGWMDDSPTGTLADHPLLRALLLELPSKGALPAADWLDRWFGAVRSILELLYVQNAGQQTRR